MSIRKNYILCIWVLVCACLPSEIFAQLTVTAGQPATILASTLAGAGVTTFGAALTCPTESNGTFSATGTLLNMSSGIVLTNGKASACAGPEGTLVSNNSGGGTDPAMAAFLPAGTSIVDACYLEFNLVATGDTLSFNYVFGSEEYRNAVCSQYTDVFAFFISGPGITGTPNMAIVPGTNIPVEINSINNGTPGTVGGANIANCHSIGAGSPFTAYYVDNTGGTLLSYRGYTTKLRAFHSVTPCDTYHLKLSIVDAGNWQFDSGVFLEGGSLSTSSSLSFNHADSMGATINGVPHTIVKGCNSAAIHVTSTPAASTSTTVVLTYSGTGVHNTDFTSPDSIVIPAGSTSALFSLSGIPTALGGPKTAVVHLTYGCGLSDSVVINILDSPYAYLLTPDTSVCSGPIVLRTIGSAGLSYVWTPAAGLSSAVVAEPSATPTATTTYSVTATLPNSGCNSITRSVTVDVFGIAISMLSHDTTVCAGTPLNLLVAGSPSYTYSWTPAIGLSNSAVQNPIATPLATTTYVVTATLAGMSCPPASANVTITITGLDITLPPGPFTICSGDSTQLSVSASGTSAVTYSWLPLVGLDSPSISNPEVTPSETTVYTVTVTSVGTTCPPVVGTETVVVIPPVTVTAKADSPTCNQISMGFYGNPTGSSFTYLWSGPSGFTSTLQNPVIDSATFANQGLYFLTVTDASNGCIGKDSVPGIYAANIIEDLKNVTPAQVINYGSSVRLNADSAQYFYWYPNDGTLSNDNINNPVASPKAPTTYYVIGVNQYGCRDTDSVFVDVIYENIFIPNAFSPNGDGLNDVFRVGNLNFYTLIEMRVFDRFGDMVYEDVSGSNKGWDGTYKNTPLDMNTYYYYITVMKPDGKTKLFFKGDITLMR
jgi:gliding motility-associated-like protein